MHRERQPPKAFGSFSLFPLHCAQSGSKINWNLSLPVGAGEPVLMRNDLNYLRSVWLSGSEPRDSQLGQHWAAASVAIEGDFAGIQGFVLRPVPGAAGAAKRLRGRSLRVIALTRLIANWLLTVFAEQQPRMLYSAGGRFLISLESCQDWQRRVATAQAQLDRWVLQQFSGEVVFHLAAAEIRNGCIPVDDLRRAMLDGRARPLAAALACRTGWDKDSFFRSAEQSFFRCPACLRTTGNPVLDEEEDGRTICRDCWNDKQLGFHLARVQQPFLVGRPDGEIEFLGKQFTLAAKPEAGEEQEEIDVIHWTPRGSKGDPLDFAGIADQACGSRKWLGYLRLDADHAGQAFRDLSGDPVRTWALSRFLQGFFCGHVQSVLQTDFKSIYPVYGGGDDLFVIGPWDQVLHFAGRLSDDFAKATEGRLTFSAGVALAKPREHILTKSDEAEHALTQAKSAGRARISALGCTVKWAEFQTLLDQSSELVIWHNTGVVKSAFIQDILGLHREWQHLTDARSEWRGSPNGSPPLAAERIAPLLHYQIERNLGGASQGDARNWAHSLVGGGTAVAEGPVAKADQELQWPFVDFVMRYAMLSSRQRPEEE